ncbi:MAG TPA: (S)-ureidoglycine aminohydrolase, partial [Acidobacteriaceae bacterium]
RSPLPYAAGVGFILHTAPQLRAGFTWATAEFALGGVLFAPSSGIERFLYVLSGKLALTNNGTTTSLSTGGYAFLPAGTDQTILAESLAQAVLIEKPYQPLAGIDDEQAIVAGHESDSAPEPLNGDPDLIVRRLMPDGPSWDFAVNTMTYAPGAALSQVEVHVMEHGLLMLEGGGIYRLGDHWYPVTAGDFIYMAPYCPQWFGALGKSQAKYLIYKDWRRHPLEP